MSQATDPGWENSGDATIRAYPDDVTQALGRNSPAAVAPPRVFPLRRGALRKLPSAPVLIGGVAILLASILIGWVWASRQSAAEARRLREAQANVALYLAEIPPNRWDIAGAAQRALEGDKLYRKNEPAEAAQKYREAFERHPSPDYALKLGELSWLRGDRPEAFGWWKRHLHDKPTSRARGYILHFFPELATASRRR